ncbi:MAG: hypothetical protein EXR72_23575 [Myxococcales bacterium]|nr:hypothetical protein [Myxococcales bacterium]
MMAPEARVAARVAARVEPARSEPGAREPASLADVALGALLGLLAGALYARTAPAVVNLDGLGYIKLIPHNFAAGHLLYMPILRMTAAALRGDGLLGGRLIDAASGGIAIATCFGCARALLARFPSVLAAAGLAVSYGVWVQGADVEAYAPALAALLGVFALCLIYRDRPSLPRALAVGLALAVAVLCHLTHVVFTPFVAAFVITYAPARRRGLWHAALAVATGGAISLAAYAFAALQVRRQDLAGAARWVATAGHGFPYGGSMMQRFADATYGLAKAFVWSPYLYESNSQALLAQFLLGLLPLATVIGLCVAGRRRLAPLPARLFALWIGPYVAMALVFFGSDHERWIFVLPPLWLLAAAAVAGLERRAWIGAGLVAYLLLANGATAIGPARHDSWDRTRADAAARVMRDGDLVLFPGHSWDEYVGFYTRTRIVPFPIAYYLGRDGQHACLARLDKEVGGARARGARIFMLRLDDDSDSRGLFELEAMGMPRTEMRRLLGRFVAVPLATDEPKVTVWRLDEPAPPAP